MISNLNISDFRLKLKENTLPGNPIIKGTPFVILTAFDSTEKLFYGNFSKSKFQLTKNSTFFAIPYVIKGNYKSENGFETVISYRIKPLWFGYLWVRVIPFLILVLTNIYILPRVNNLEIETLIFINIFLLLFFIPALITISLKKKLEQNFKYIFEIKD